jgi:hypothetical protein
MVGGWGSVQLLLTIATVRLYGSHLYALQVYVNLAIHLSMRTRVVESDRDYPTLGCLANIRALGNDHCPHHDNAYAMVHC